ATYYLHIIIDGHKDKRTGFHCSNQKTYGSDIPYPIVNAVVVRIEYWSFQLPTFFQLFYQLVGNFHQRLSCCLQSLHRRPRLIVLYIFLIEDTMIAPHQSHPCETQCPPCLRGEEKA